MGCAFFGTSSKCNCEPSKPDINPKPNNYTIKNCRIFGTFAVIRILYPDAKNFEGMKIIVAEKKWLEKARHNHSIDPHFGEKSGIIARFVPTDEGWEMAKDFARGLSRKV